jgi:signal transduction histidine kinase
MAQAVSSPNPTTASTGRSRIPAWLWDVTAGVFVVLAGCTPNPELPPLTVPGFAVTVVSLAALSAVLPLRRRYPMVILALCVLLAVLAPLWTTSVFGFFAASAIAMYRVAEQTTRRRTIVLTVIASAALVASTASSQLLGLGYSHVLPPLAIVAVAAALGDATRNRRAFIDTITERAVRAEETRELEAERRVTEERLRIARELHDAAAHQIAAISLHAGVASNALRTRPDDAEHSLEVIRASARAVLSEISALLRVLRSTPATGSVVPAPPTASLDALDRLVDDFEESGLSVSRQLRGDISRVQGATSFVAYRIVQEGLANALKHGADEQVDLAIEVKANLLILDVSNRVDEARLGTTTGSGQHGLIGMQERVDSIRGALMIQRDGPVFALHAELPFHPTPVTGVEKH